MSTTIDRRLFVKSLLGTAVLGALAACSPGASAGPVLTAADPLPTEVPPGTALKVAAPNGAQKLALELSGLIDRLPFTVPEWANVSAGPDVINAFRAKSLELASNAGIPPIQAAYQGYDAKIVAVQEKHTPTLRFATKPGSDIASVEDFRGKKIAFSQGQAQGVVVLRQLKQAGIDYGEVELVPLTTPQFLTSLQAGQVDIAPLTTLQVPKYLDQYAADGARAIETDVVDLLTVLWAPTEVLEDPAKAAAIAAYIPLWAQSTVWYSENPEEWVQKYYVQSQNLVAEEGRAIVDLTGLPHFPASWDEAIAWEQETADLLAEGGFVDALDVSALFDRRFESLAAAAVAETYRS
ncbi:ABC transporter substrate-binding protein [Rhodococcus phenolicus]|uniref:ABC transporter substrate-binding protein n=1 Tax=Rhodococcus phenolicus TaxID=263849 RepID=UPI0008315247|nr:ABC transporter substrate-binding protein [Rhodococcus phenolicus]